MVYVCTGVLLVPFCRWKHTCIVSIVLFHDWLCFEMMPVWALWVFSGSAAV